MHLCSGRRVWRPAKNCTVAKVANSAVDARPEKTPVFPPAAVRAQSTLSRQRAQVKTVKTERITPVQEAKKTTWSWPS